MRAPWQVPPTLALVVLAAAHPPHIVADGLQGMPLHTTSPRILKLHPSTHRPRPRPRRKGRYPPPTAYRCGWASRHALTHNFPPHPETASLYTPPPASPVGERRLRRKHPATLCHWLHVPIIGTIDAPTGEHSWAETHPYPSERTSPASSMPKSTAGAMARPAMWSGQVCDCWKSTNPR